MLCRLWELWDTLLLPAIASLRRLSARHATAQRRPRPPQVYKLHGSPHGFLVSAAVAAPDPQHPATLLRFALHLHQAAQKVWRARGLAGGRGPPLPFAAMACCVALMGLVFLPAPG